MCSVALPRVSSRWNWMLVRQEAQYRVKPAMFVRRRRCRAGVEGRTREVGADDHVALGVSKAARRAEFAISKTEGVVASKSKWNGP